MRPHITERLTGDVPRQTLNCSALRLASRSHSPAASLLPPLGEGRDGGQAVAWSAMVQAPTQPFPSGGRECSVCMLSFIANQD